MVGSKPSSLISLSNRQIHLCEQLAAVATLSNEPKLLVKTLSHAKKAIEYAALAVAYALDGEEHEVHVVFKMLHEEIPISREAERIYDEITEIATAYENTHTVVRKNNNVWIVNDDFSDLQQLSAGKIERMLTLIKEFVYEAGKRALLGEMQV